jgi:DNA (cytosine-5)-methyltransferase 1
MTVGSLFDGIGGFDWLAAEPVDLICGGFPCQPFSLAGQRKGTADDRYLWPAMLHAVAVVQPTWVIAENVPGIIGPALDEVLSDLEAAGYETGTLALPACAFDAPHIRQRLWILAHRDRTSRRMEPGRLERAGRTEGQAEPGHDGAHGHVADTDHSHESDVPIDGVSWLRVSADDSGGNHAWATEPELDRVAYGIPHRVDRLRGLGNAIVPQIAEWLGRQILKVNA